MFIHWAKDPSAYPNVDYVRCVHTRTPKEGSFAQVCSFIDDVIAADRGGTGGGVRAGDAGNAGNGDAGGRSARRGHHMGDRDGGAGALHAGRLRHAGGRLLPDEERRERGGQDPGDDGHRHRGLLAAGFAFAFGAGNAIIGTQGFFMGGDEATYAGLSWTAVPVSAKFLFQVAFALVSLAIVWGTMLERTKFAVYCIFAVVFAGLIYPIVGHWIWGGGWLSEFGMQDFAGSTVVHLSGAMAALAGTLLLGPRIGKYDDAGNPQTIPGHNMPLAVLGVIILWVGWWGFNPGSTMSAVGASFADIAL